MNISSIKSEIDVPNYEITPENFENILSVHEDQNGYYYFNLLNTIHFPTNLDSSMYDIYIAKPEETYTIISYNFYGSTKLWWLVCGMNQILDPTYPPYAGRPLKILKRQYIPQILAKMTTGE